MYVKIKQKYFFLYKNLDVEIKGGQFFVAGFCKGVIENIKYKPKRKFFVIAIVNTQWNRSFHSIYFVKFANSEAYERFSDYIDVSLDICVICLMPIFIERKCCKNCKNSFHKGCAASWAKRKKTCAICKG